MISNRKTWLQRIFLGVILAVTVWGFAPGRVLAMTEAQKRLFNKGVYYYNLEDCSAATESTPANVVAGKNAEENARVIHSFLVGKGLTKAQSGGILANLFTESASTLDPRIVQGGSFADEVTVDGHTGYGIAQWTTSNRQQGLKDAATRAGKKSSDLGVQVSYLWKELTTSHRQALSNLKKTTDYRSAVDVILNQFEAPLDRNQVDSRANAFKPIYDKLSEAAGATADEVAAAGGEASLGTDCACTNPAPEATTGKTVAIDPGHGPSKTVTDAKTGLKMVESNNQPEGRDVWDVAQKVKKKLQDDGYKVILVKETEDEEATFRQRAQRADDANADIAVSINGDSGLGNKGEIYTQKVGLYRGSGENKTEFTDETVASLSQKFAETMQEERKKVEGSDIIIKDNSFNGRAGLEPGNIQMVQLFSRTPWVYNEAKMSFDKDKYAEGLINGIEKALEGSKPKDADSTVAESGCNGSSLGNGDAVATAMDYAWPEYHPAEYFKMKPSYERAVQKARAANKYVGGCGPAGCHPGIDCGGFVTRVMQDSGVDPNYNEKKGPTTEQQAYMESHPDKYEAVPSSGLTVDKLRPGDIAVNDHHTYMFVGPEKDHPDFHGNSASASYARWRTPMASNATDFKDYQWYRPKK